MTGDTCQRARTMSLRALRRLSETELSGLRIALDVVSDSERFLIARLDRLRKAVAKERRARAMAGLNGPGEYAQAYQTILEVVRMLTYAREETSSAVDAGRIPKP